MLLFLLCFQITFSPQPTYDPFFYAAGENIAGGLATAMGYAGRPYTTQSLHRYLPAYDGFMMTKNTYRHVSVRDQVLTMLGEGKHGLWSVQEAGFIREYLRPGATGLPSSATDKTADLETLLENYSSYIVDPSNPANFASYVYPWQRINAAGTLQYIDLPINHAKYGGKYTSHAPLDLRYWYCTMSKPNAPNASRVLEYAYAQPEANKVGPLGKRAGLDIQELFINVLRLRPMADTRAWANIGPRSTESILKSGAPGSVNFVAIDPQRTLSEYYLVERPFFNVKYQFIIAVFDDEMKSHSYMRPQGSYWESLLARGYKARDFPTEVQKSRFYYSVPDKSTLLKNGAFAECPVNKPAYANGLPLYGAQGLNFGDYGAGGGCPHRGGDWADYPSPSGGSGWPTQYQEIPPWCDAILVDIKFFANLHSKPSNDPGVGLASGGQVMDPVDYRVLSYAYGAYDASYDVGGSSFLANKVNPWAFNYSSLWNTSPGEITTLSLSYGPASQYHSYIGPKPEFPLPYAEPVPYANPPVEAPVETPDLECPDDDDDDDDDDRD